MPNYVFNSFTIEGLTKTQKEEIETAVKEENLFNSIVPEPNWMEIPDENGDLPQEVKKDDFPHTFREFPNGVADDRWYKWRCDNWGCKWEASDLYFGEDTKENTVVVRFNTAWTPPSQFTTALTKLYPAAKITNVFIEEDAWFGGTLAIGGKALTWTFDKNKFAEKWLEEFHPECDFSDLYEDPDISDEWFDVQEIVITDHLDQQFKASETSLLMGSIIRSK